VYPHLLIENAPEKKSVTGRRLPSTKIGGRLDRASWKAFEDREISVTLPDMRPILKRWYFWLTLLVLLLALFVGIGLIYRGQSRINKRISTAFRKGWPWSKWRRC
jgi:hypothetical protein